MTRSEWMGVVKLIRARWPHAELPDETIAIWFTDVDDLAAEDVDAAVTTLYRDGREFPPNSAQIRERVLKLGRGDPDWGEAWELVQRALRKFGLHHEHRQGDALEWLEANSPAVAEAVRRFGPDELAMSADGIVRAQFRDIYRDVVDGGRRRESYAGLALPAKRRELGGLRRFELVPDRESPSAQEKAA